MIASLFPCLFGDGVILLLATIVPLFCNPALVLRVLNCYLVALRKVIGHVFIDHHLCFKVFEVPARLQLFQKGAKNCRIAFGYFFVHNYHCCMGGPRACYFSQVPPIVEAYIPLNKCIPPAPVV